MRKKRVIFIGCELVGAKGLESLINSNIRNKIEVVGIITCLYIGKCSQPVAIIANALKLPCFQGDINSQEALKWIKNLSPDYGVIMQYQKIPSQVISLFKDYILNVHPSDLPKFRGGSPLENLIIYSEPLTITVHKITESFDNGPWCHKTSPLNVSGLNLQMLYNLAANQMSLAIESALYKILQGTVKWHYQKESEASYAWHKELDNLLTITKDDSCCAAQKKILAGGLERAAIIYFRLDNKLYKLRCCDGFYFYNYHNKKNRIIDSFSFEAILEKNENLIIQFKDGNLVATKSHLESTDSWDNFQQQLEMDKQNIVLDNDSVFTLCTC